MYYAIEFRLAKLTGSSVGKQTKSLTMCLFSFTATSGPLITALPDDDSISHARPVIRFPEESVPSSQPIVSSPVSTAAGKGLHITWENTFNFNPFLKRGMKGEYCKGESEC